MQSFLACLKASLQNRFPFPNICEILIAKKKKKKNLQNVQTPLETRLVFCEFQRLTIIACGIKVGNNGLIKQYLP